MGRSHDGHREPRSAHRISTESHGCSTNCAPSGRAHTSRLQPPKPKWPGNRTDARQCASSCPAKPWRPSQKEPRPPLLRAARRSRFFILPKRNVRAHPREDSACEHAFGGDRRSGAAEGREHRRGRGNKSDTWGRLQQMQYETRTDSETGEADAGSDDAWNYGPTDAPTLSPLAKAKNSESRFLTNPASGAPVPELDSTPTT